jgi:CRP-like cAMP-binding protein
MKGNPIAISVVNSTVFNDYNSSEVNKFENNPAAKPVIVQEVYSNIIVKTNSRFVISYRSLNRIIWELLIVIISIYMCICIPLFLVFYQQYFNHPGFLTIQLIISVIYSIDIIIVLRTTFIDESTIEEVGDNRKIIKKYFKSPKMILDIVSIVPFEFLSPSSLSLIRLLKVYRFLNLSKLVSEVKIHQVVKLILKFGIVLCIFIIFMHFTACIFFLILDQDQTWVPPEDEELYQNNFYNQGPGTEYWHSFYHSIFFIVGIKNGGESTDQYIFFSSFYIIGAIISAKLLGDMTFIMRNARVEDSLFNETYDSLSTAMRNLRLPSSLRYRITEFFVSNYKLLKYNNDYRNFIKMLPHSLVKQLNNKILNQVIKKNPIFYSTPKVLKHVIVRLQSVFLQPGVSVISQFDDNSELYFIINGVCNIEVVDEFKRNHLVGQLTEGNYFGEIGLLFNTESTATIITSTYSSLASLDKNNFQEMLDIFPTTKSVFIQKIAQYKDNWMVFIKNMIRYVPYLKNLDPESLVMLMYSLKQERFDSDEIIFKESPSTNCLYFIVEGEVELFTHIYDREALKIISGNEANLIGWRTDRKSKNLSKFALSLGVLQIGSCIFPRLCLSKGEVLISAKALTSTHVLILSDSLLENLTSYNSNLLNSVEKYRETLFKFDSIRNEFLPEIIPIDVIKNYKYSTGIPKKVWKPYLKFKNAVLKIIYIKRKLRIKSIGSVKRMVKKLKAMNYAESLGKYDLLNQIANDQISEDSVKVIHLLEDSELKNELLRQFAIKANETSIVSQYLSGRLKSCRKKIRKLSLNYQEIEKIGASIEKLLLESIKISKAHRISNPINK